ERAISVFVGGVFFFQAEDGIRDANVTGVQTCALPIWKILRDRLWHAWVPASRIGGECVRVARTWTAEHHVRRSVIQHRRIADVRSEERRVGKEWRWMCAHTGEAINLRNRAKSWKGAGA